MVRRAGPVEGAREGGPVSATVADRIVRQGYQRLYTHGDQIGFDPPVVARPAGTEVPNDAERIDRAYGEHAVPVSRGRYVVPVLRGVVPRGVTDHDAIHDGEIRADGDRRRITVHVIDLCDTHPSSS